MTDRLLAEFTTADALLKALQEMQSRRYRVLELFTPFPLDGVRYLEKRGASIRPLMLLAGLATAAFAYALQWYSAVINYPINSGGRPLHSWPVFLLVPFEVGAFAAALAGLIGFLWSCGMPRPRDSMFGVPGFRRASQDRFFLLAELDDASDEHRLRQLLSGLDAVAVTRMVQP
jgi:ActD protein